MMYLGVIATVLLGVSANPTVTRRDSEFSAPTGAYGLPCGAKHYSNYVVKKGDGVGAITKKATAKPYPGFNVGICDIGTANGLTNINYIQLDQVLKIPTDCTTIDNTSCNPPNPTPAAATCVKGSPPNVYRVFKGDTLTKIAEDFKITLDSLEAANRQNIPDPDKIYPDEPVNFPLCDRSSCKSKQYQIQSGDTYFLLSSRAATTIGQLKAANPKVDYENMPVGLTITLPYGCHGDNEPEPQCPLCGN